MRRVMSSGFTLIELMIVIIVLAIILVVAVPSFVETLERRKVINATQALTGQIQQARSLAITRNRGVSLVVRSENDGSWCFGLTDLIPDPTASPPGDEWCQCSPSAPTNRCTVALPDQDDPTDVTKSDAVEILADSTQFRGVGVNVAASPAFLTFEPTRGLRRAGNVNQFEIVSDRRAAIDVQVTVNAIGRIGTCSPSGSNLAGGVRPCDP